MGQWKYFTDDEVKGLNVELVKALDFARGIYGKPMVITSGLRTPDQNKAVGGVDDSAHETGLAVDIACPKPSDQTRLVWALGAAGISRVGLYPAHVHGDVDHTKPWPALWYGTYK